MQLDIQPASRLHDVHVNVGAGVFRIRQIEQRFTFDNADARGRDEVADRHRADDALFEQLVEGEDQRHESAGNRRSTGAAVRLDDVAIERHRPLAQLLELRHRTERTADQSLNLLRSAADASCRRLALRSRARRAGQHAVFGRDPALSRIPAKRRHAVFDTCGADDLRLARFHEHGAFGVNQVVGSDPGRTKLFGQTAVRAHSLSL